MTKRLIKNYSILNDGKYFFESGSENYLEFQPFSRYFTSKNGKIGSWHSKGISEKSVTPPPTTEKSFDHPEIIYNYGKGKIKLKGICLKQDSVSS